MNKVKDHTGREFKNITKMCEFWGVNLQTFSSRINKYGCSLEEALTKKDEYVYDHKGHKYATTVDMCNAYHISYSIFKNRYIRRKWSLEKTLETPQLRKQKYEIVTDHTGREFKSFKEMCNEYNIPESTVNNRLLRGWSLEKALTGDNENYTDQYYRTDHMGREFDSVVKLCKYYQVDKHVYRKRCEKNLTKLEALGIIPVLNFRLRKYRVNSSLFIEKYFMQYGNESYFICINDNREEIFSRTELLKIFENEILSGKERKDAI